MKYIYITSPFPPSNLFYMSPHSLRSIASFSLIIIVTYREMYINKKC